MYQYVTEHHGNANELPAITRPFSSTLSPAESVCLVEGLHKAPVTMSQIQNWKRREPVMSNVW